MLRFHRTLAALACAALLVAPVVAGGPAFAFELEDINPLSRTHGQRIALGDLYAERGVMLEFVASWCKICRDALPEIERLRADSGVPIVYVAADEWGRRESIVAIAEREALATPILFVPLDEVAVFEQHYDYEILPATYLIDRRGRVRSVHEGRVSRDTLDAELDGLASRAQPSSETPSATR